MAMQKQRFVGGALALALLGGSAAAQTSTTTGVVLRSRESSTNNGAVVLVPGVGDAAPEAGKPQANAVVLMTPGGVPYTAGGTTPATATYSTNAPQTYPLLTNQTANGSSASVPIVGGGYFDDINGTFGGATVTETDTDPFGGVTTQTFTAPFHGCGQAGGGTKVVQVVTGATSTTNLTSGYAGEGQCSNPMDPNNAPLLNGAAMTVGTAYAAGRSLKVDCPSTSTVTYVSGGLTDTWAFQAGTQTIPYAVTQVTSQTGSCTFHEAL